MGEVWKARDTRLDRTVAIKTSAKAFSERFEREARAIAALNHPNICQIYDVGPDYIVMEYVEGGEIKGPLPLDQALKAAIQLAAALEAAHRKSITHRDLKPANILTTKSGIKVLDFGHAKFELMKDAPSDETKTRALTQEGTIVGTLQYVAPEQLQGKPIFPETEYPRASSFAFRGRENAIAEIGEKLQVSNVLHGSVRRSGNRIRVSAQIITVAGETQIWSERYDREMRDIFDIQDEIAQAIVAQLKVKLGPKSGRPLVKRYTENPEAHRLYLKGSFHFRRLTNEEMERGREYLEQAVALEPLYAPAWFHLADYYIARAHRGAVSPLERWPRARAAAARALEADPEFADAHAALSFVKAVSEFQWEEGLRELDTALRLNPSSALAHFWRAYILCCLGRTEEALAGARRAVEIDPLSALFRSYCALFCLHMGQTGRALEHALQALDVNPNYPIGQLALGEAYSLLGRHKEGIDWMEKTQPGAPAGYFYFGFLALAYLRAGRRADAMRLRVGLEEKRSCQYISPAALAFTAVSLGDVESAFQSAGEAIGEREPNIMLSIRSPYFQPLQSDPRYHDLLRSMNLQP